MSTSVLRVISLAAVLTFSSLLGAAQQERPDDPDRGRVLAELKPYRHDFIVKELSLSKDQAEKFLPVYDQMNIELQKISDETRDLERTISADDDADDAAYEAAARVIFEQRSKEGDVELEYFDKFRTILTPHQLLMLKNAERKFNQSLIRRHRNFSNMKQGR